MSKKEKLENGEKISITQKISNHTEGFLQRNSKLLLIICAVIIVAIIVVAVISVTSEKKNQALYVSLDDLENSYTKIVAMDTTSAEYKTAVDGFYTECDALTSEGKSKYPAQKATMLKGDMYFIEENWADAASAYEAASVLAKDTYIGPLALCNAAAASENNGDSAKALELYKKVWDVYGKEAPEASRALFNTARLYEAQGNIDLAKAAYQQVADEFRASSSGSANEYAALAKNRLLVL